MKKTAKVNKKKKKGFHFFRVFFLTLLFIIILCFVAGTGIIMAIIKTAPKLDVNQILDLNETSVLYDDKNNPMDDVIVTNANGVVERRTVINISDMPKNLTNAFISIEDERFYQHNGVDPKGITRATLLDLQNKITHQSKSIQGASTITQQLIKLRLFYDESLADRLDPKRKIQEIYLSLQLEKSLSKNDILEAYLNTIFLGGNANGVEAAANQYFNKSAKDLNLTECAFLAGINQSPSYYYPFQAATRKNPSRYINRTIQVLQKMLDLGKITKAQYDSSVKDIKTNKKFFNPSTKNVNMYTYEWFSRPVMQSVKADLKAQYHYSDTEISNLLMNGGLKIYTTMNKNLEDKAQNIINNDSIFNQVNNESKKPLQASTVIMDYHTGDVKVIIGGRGNQPANSYNRATAFYRPTGSSIKPLTVYGAAIDSKLATAATVIDDSRLPDNIASKYVGSNGAYQPMDDDGQYLGPLTIRDALRMSRNVVAVRLEDQIGVQTGITYAEKFGIQLNNEDKRSTSIAAMALGQLSHGTNTLTMAAAYGVFGNYGMYSNPKLYTKVVDKTGKTILENKYTSKKVLSPEAAFIMYDLLKGPVSAGGTGPSAQIEMGSMPVSGKTGTATDSKDLWFCGLTPYYSGAVWLGNDDDSKFYGLNSNSSAQLWGELMKEANTGLSVKDIVAPAGVTRVTICRDSGKLATSLCAQDPRGNRTFSELFIDGTQPTDSCDEHVQTNINKSNGKLATSNTPANLIEQKVYLKNSLPKESDDTPSSQNSTDNKAVNNENTATQPNTNTDTNINTPTNPTDPNKH